MKFYSFDEICRVLDIRPNWYTLAEEQIVEYFNYFVKYLGKEDPRQYIQSKKLPLGCAHGLFYIMLGKFLKEIDENYDGTEETKSLLFHRFSNLDPDILAEIFVLGQLKQNGCNLKCYAPVGGKDPEAIISINGIDYTLDVTKIHWEDENGKSKKSEIGMKKLDQLLKKYPQNFGYFANKTIIFEPNTSFQKFIDAIMDQDLFTNYFLKPNDEVRILDGIHDCPGLYGYDCIIGGHPFRICVVSYMGAIYSKVWEKYKDQYKDIPFEFLLYIDVTRRSQYGYGGGFLTEARNALKSFPKCAGIILFERDCVAEKASQNDIFSSCFFIVNEKSKNPPNPIQNDGYNFTQIDKCILSQNNYFILTNNGNDHIVSRRPFPPHAGNS